MKILKTFNQVVLATLSVPFLLLGGILLAISSFLLFLGDLEEEVEHLKRQ